MYEGEIKSAKNVVTIIGQNYRKNWFYPVQVAVKKVDGKTVFSDLLRFRPVTPYVTHIDPGTHELEIFAAYGSIYHPKPPVLRVYVEAGQVYQINYQLLSILDGVWSPAYNLAYRLRYIGDIEEYEDYLSKHPEYEPGSLLPKLNEERYFPRRAQ